MNDKLSKYDFNPSEEINILEVGIFLLKKRKQIFYVGLISLFLSSFYAFWQDDIYQSSASLIPFEQNNSLTDLPDLGGLASLAGISLSQSSDRSAEAIERITSFGFFKDYFLPSILLENLMAIDKWNPLTKKISYDESIFDSAKKEWIRKERFPKKRIPSEQEAFEKYLKIMSISQDNKTKFVSLSINHKSAEIAQNFVKKIIDLINSSMREADKVRTLKSIDFLNNEMRKVQYIELKQAISSLQQDQMEALMLIEANEEYIFQILNPPIISEEKYSPNRLLIIFIGTIAGIFLCAFYYSVFYIVKNSQNNI